MLNAAARELVDQRGQERAGGEERWSRKKYAAGPGRDAPHAVRPLIIRVVTAPLVLLHGFTQTGRSWGPVREHLQLDPPREIFTPDQRGHGDASGVRPILLPAMAADAMAQAPGELALAGYSMGVRAALLAAIASARAGQPPCADLDDRRDR